jgi:hypothetical protein
MGDSAVARPDDFVLQNLEEILDNQKELQDN